MKEIVMNYLELILLHCFAKVNGERTAYSVLHLLNGKRSSQTIQDAYLFSLKDYFHTLPMLNRDVFNQSLSKLKDNSCIKLDEQAIVRITNLGSSLLEEHSLLTPLPSILPGWDDHKTVEHFWKRFNLLTQLVSNLAYGEHKFVPVVKDPIVQSWTKSFLFHYSIPVQKLTGELYKEIIDILEKEEFPVDPSIITIRLSGYQVAGKTTQQSSHLLGMDSVMYWYRFLEGITYIVKLIKDNQREFPHLSFLVADLMSHFTLTESTTKTYELVKRGLSLKEISSARKLRLSTIEDHVIEIALNDSSFSIDHYIPEEDARSVWNKARATSTKKLKPIKESFPHLTYFQIRLALAKGALN
ncbi:helix-turn-helix domain-containing protein [Bacillus coahuilensis]|nr:helix-turn-helix domain-containing protein [Bacillus coahuilensis]